LLTLLSLVILHITELSAWKFILF